MGEIVALLAVLAFSLCLRGLVVDLPLERDEGQYGYIAWRWLDGALPYVDSFDQKPPAVYLVYAAAFSIFGVSPEGLHWATGIYTLGTLVALYALGRRLVSAEAGLAGAAVLGFLVVEPSFFGNAANTETFLILPMVLGLHASLVAAERASPGWAFLAGILGAVACLFKQVAAFNLLYCGLIVTFAGSWRPDFRQGTAIMAGALLPLLATLALFAAAGALQPLLDHVLWNNLGYSARQELSEYPRAFWRTFAPSIGASGGIYALAAAGLLLRDAPAAGAPRAPGRDPRWLLLGWLVFSLLGVSVGGYFRHHYHLQAMPAVALLAGAGAVALARAALPPHRQRAGTVVLLVVAIGAGLLASRAYFFPSSPAAASRALYGTSPFAESPRVARFIAERTRPDETIFVFGSEPQIPLLAGRRSASRYILMYPLFGPYPKAREWQQEALAEILAERPAFIVVTTQWVSFLGHPGAPDDLPRGLVELLRREFQPVARVPLEARDDLAVVREADARTMWAASPNVSDPRVWGNLVVFQRRERTAPEPDERGSGG